MTKTRQWTIFTAVAVIVVLAAGWLLLIKPQSSHAADLRSQADSQEQTNQGLQTQIAQLKSEEKSLPQQQAALRKFTTQVPDNAAEPTLIRQLSAIANGSGVDLVSMTPGTATTLTSTTTAAPGSTSLTAPTAGGQLFELPVVMVVNGTYPNVESFFQAIEHLPRATLVGSWTLSPAKGNSSDGTTSALGSSSTGKSLAPGALTGTLNANVFYSPPSGATTSASVVGGATATTPAPATTTPATTTPAVPAPTSTTAS